MRRIRGLVLQRAHDHAFNVVVADHARRTRTGLIDQPVETPLDEPTPPLPDRGLVHIELRGDRHVVDTLGALEHDPRPLRQRVRRLRSPRPPPQRLTFLVGERQRLLRTTPAPHTSQYELSSTITRAIPDAAH
jgi:hypothetical protein